MTPAKDTPMTAIARPTHLITRTALLAATMLSGLPALAFSQEANTTTAPVSGPETGGEPAGAPTSVLPVDGRVVAGAASINTVSNGMRSDQATARTVIDWRSFSIGQGKSVEFVQPDVTSVALNRVTGSAGSEIAGQLTSNGTVYLVNSNGIFITSSGTVRSTGGFVASTLDISNGDFMAGRTRFTGTGASKGVTNAGSIVAGQGAYVALLGGAVANSGTISVPAGKVAIGSGEQIALDLNGDNFLRVGAPTSLITGDDALLDNSGSITVAGGRIEMRAAVLRDAVRNVVNMSGDINADSAVGDGGTIYLFGGADAANMAGTVKVSGSLSARATGVTGNGGFIETSGEKIDLDGVRVNTLAANGRAGEWLIDPNYFTIGLFGSGPNFIS